MGEALTLHPDDGRTVGSANNSFANLSDIRTTKKGAASALFNAVVNVVTINVPEPVYPSR